MPTKSAAYPPANDSRTPEIDIFIEFLEEFRHACMPLLRLCGLLLVSSLTMKRIFVSFFLQKEGISCILSMKITNISSFYYIGAKKHDEK